MLLLNDSKIIIPDIVYKKPPVTIYALVDMQDKIQWVGYNHVTALVIRESSSIVTRLITMQEVQ